MTKWEIGQDLIRISDDIGESCEDFIKAGEKDLSDELSYIRGLIGDLFDKNNNHSFGIFNSEDNKG